MKKLLISLAVAALVFGGFAQPAQARTSDAGLQAKIDQVWGPTNFKDFMNNNVTWYYASIPDPKNGGYYGGVTYYDCFLFWCVYRIYVLPNYGDDLNVIAHEGGHAICNAWYKDNSERCADVVARRYYPSYPY